MKKELNWKIHHTMTDDMLKQAIELDQKAFCQKHVGIYEKCKEWLSVNDNIYTVLTLNDKVVGYLNFIPITDECYEKFKSGTYEEYDIRKDEIRQYKEKGEYKGLFDSIGIDIEYRDGDAIIKLWEGFKEKIQKLKEQGILISSLLSNCVSIDGIKHIINHVNGKYICSSVDGKIYEGNLNPQERDIPKLRYEELNKDNLKIMSKMQYEIFKNLSDIGYIDLLNELRTKDLKDNNRLPITFLTYYQDRPVGIIGLYQFDKASEDIWLSWLGVLPEYRHKGIGTQMLLYTISLARTYDKKALRLFTFANLSPDAQNIYRKTMQIEENYANENDCINILKQVDCKVFSSSLVDKVASKWDNKYIGVKDIINAYGENLAKLKEDKII